MKHVENQPHCRPNRIPPGPRSGRHGQEHLEHLRDNFLGFVTRLAQQYGDCVHYRVGLVPVYQFTHPDQFEEILVTKARAFHKTDRLRQVLGRVLGNGMLLREGNAWAQQRRLLQPAFHPRRLAGHASTVIRRTREMIDASAGLEVDIGPVIRHLTLLIAGDVLFGAELAPVVESVTREVNTLQAVAYADFTARRSDLLRSSNENTALLRRTTESLVRTVQEIVEDTYRLPDGRKGLLSSFLALAKTNAGVSHKQVYEESLLLLLAGHATTATAVTWAVSLLAEHPEVQQRVRTEVNQAWGAGSEVGGHERLPFTTAVFHEAMRLFPPVYTTSRQAIEPVKIAGYMLPAGAQVHLVPYVTHRDERWFIESELFCPERFTASTKGKIPRFAYMPFGAGPRACLGGGLALMEGVLILATLVRHCQFSRAEGQRTPAPEPRISLQPKGPIDVYFSQRQAASAS